MLIKCVQKIAQCNSLKYFSISTQRKLRLKFHMRETFLFGLIKRIAELVTTKKKLSTKCSLLIQGQHQLTRAQNMATFQPNTKPEILYSFRVSAFFPLYEFRQR